MTTVDEHWKQLLPKLAHLNHDQLLFAKNWFIAGAMATLKAVGSDGPEGLDDNYLAAIKETTAMANDEMRYFREQAERN